MRIVVKVAGDAVSGGNRVEASSGGATGASLERPVAVDGAPTPFGVEDFRFVPEEEGGAVDTRAGSHPFQLTATLALNQNTDLTRPPALARDLRFLLPPGLVGNASSVAQCSETRLRAPLVRARHQSMRGGYRDRGRDGDIHEPYFVGLATFAVPVFNMVPGRGEPARFGFSRDVVPVILDTSVRTGGDYGATVSVNNISQIPRLFQRSDVLGCAG